MTPQTVSVSASLSDPAPTSSLSIGANELGTESEVFVLVHPTTLGIAKVTPGPGNTLPAVFNIQFNIPLFMGVGTYNDTIQVSMCFDQACSHPLYGSPQTIPVQYTVTKSTLPPLTLNSLSPTSVTVGGSPFMLTVLGNGFSIYSTVQWNGVKLTTTYVSATEIVAQVPAASISAAGTATVTVSDPTNSHATTSSPQSIAITAASKDAVAFQNNAAHTGAVTFANLSFPGIAKWSVDVGGTPSYAIVAQGKVIVTVSSSGGAQLLALDQATGNTVWGPIALSNDSNAVYDAGRVYVLSFTIGSAAVLQAYDAGSGALDWSTTLSGQYEFELAPTAADGTVYAVGAGLDATLYAVDESTGTLKWTQDINSGISTPAVSADGVYTTSECETFDLRPATGEVIWHNSACGGGPEGTTPVVAGQLLYDPDQSSGFSGDVLNAETGDKVDVYLADSPPAFTSTMGFFLHDRTLSGVTLTDDKAQWTFTGDGELQGSPLAVDQYVFIGSATGNLYAVDSTTGLQAWNVSLGAAVDIGDGSMQITGLAAGDGLLIVPAGTKVIAYTLSTNP
ncbi:MAG TPA: PQQ-binding-like beta-propeller repeat protein [Gammaproteobacteria bacterium]|nr:PQQ-binding-like beta-propeller repeat protein [Gammaproteobacteria bacterium]